MALQARGTPLVVLDCSFDLGDTGGRRTRLAPPGHLPGAHYAHLDRDLSGPKDGRNGAATRCPHAQRGPAALGRWGVQPGVQVVGLRRSGRHLRRTGLVAAALAGARAVAVLDGGIAAWTARAAR
jgi:thiosulfate/3-mercaptopyruvate sulfurtransferase